MKEDSDNVRESSIFNVINNLVEYKSSICIFEPYMTKSEFPEYSFAESIDDLKKQCQVIIANRLDGEMKSYKGVLISRDTRY